MNDAMHPLSEDGTEGHTAGNAQAVPPVSGDASPRLSVAHGGALPDDAREEREIEDALGESLANILDIRQWNEGIDLAGLYAQLGTAVADTVAQAERTRGPLRALLLKTLRDKAGQGTAPESAGLYRLEVADIEFVHKNLLFNGATECCDGTVVAHDSLLLTVAQIGVSLVAYQGNAGTWVQRLYRRDLTGHFPDPMEEAIALLERRDRSDSADAEETRDPLSAMLRRGLMEYAERAVLLHHSLAPWRMGHGNPIPGLVLMMSIPSLFYASLEVLEALYLGHRRFVYVASSPANRLVRTLGDALKELEYAVIGSFSDIFTDTRINKLTDTSVAGHPKERAKLKDFLDRIPRELVYGVFRVAEEAPAQVFYTHKDHVHTAAAIAMADSALQPHRGFPMLIDLADLTRRHTFDAASFAGTVSDAYSAAGYPLRYLGERETRNR